MKLTVVDECLTVIFRDCVTVPETRGVAICVLFVEYLTNNHILLKVSTERIGQINPRLSRHAFIKGWDGHKKKLNNYVSF